MYCPKCCSEYQPQIVFCQACGVSLVNDLKRLTPEEQRRYEQELQALSVIECQNCGTHNRPSAQTCSNCGGPLTPEEAFGAARRPLTAPGEGIPPVADVPPIACDQDVPAVGRGRYHALRFIQSVYRVFTWILGLLIPIVGMLCGASATRGPFGGGGGTPGAFVGLVVGAVIGCLAWLLLMSAAETIAVVIDTEENTRRTADAVAELTRRGAA